MSCRRRGMRSEIVGGVGVREKEKGRMKSGRIESQEECKERSQGKMNYLQKQNGEEVNTMEWQEEKEKEKKQGNEYEVDENEPIIAIKLFSSSQSYQVVISRSLPSLVLCLRISLSNLSLIFIRAQYCILLKVLLIW